MGEQTKNLLLALTLSAGVHLIFLMSLDGSPGVWRHGLQPALQVSFTESSTVPGISRSTASRSELPVPPKLQAGAQGKGRPGTRDVAGATLPRDPRYYRNSEVDIPAVPLNRPRLIIPEIAYFSRLAGTVRARVYIGADGAVENIEIVRVLPRGGIFEDAALAALRQLRYTPAELSGHRVKSVKTIEVVFDSRDEESG